MMKRYLSVVFGGKLIISMACSHNSQVCNMDELDGFVNVGYQGDDGGDFNPNPAVDAIILDPADASSSYYSISTNLRNEGLNKIQNRIRELGLNNDPSVQVVISGATDSAEQSTIDRYKGYWRGLEAFCIEIGDYDSAMIVSRNICPSRPPPVKMDTAIAFLKFQVEPKVCEESGAPNILLHHLTQQPVVSAVTGLPMVCQENWNCVPTIKLYAASLEKLHGKYETTRGVYIEACDECIEMHRLTRQACALHTGMGGAKLVTVGNPRQGDEFKNVVKQMLKVAVDRDLSRSTFAYAPHELRAIRDHCLATNNLYDMMIWTIMIIGIKLFLRVDEVLSLTVEDFQTNLFVLNKLNVTGLMVEVFGKSEKKDGRKVILSLWDDKDCPDFSGTRALMLWLVKSGIYSGKLFPSKSELQTGATTPSVGITYEAFHARQVHFCKNVLGKRNLDKVIIGGTHMLRKTGYLLAIWGLPESSTGIGPITEAEILEAARHSTFGGNAHRYILDSRMRKQVIMDIPEYDGDPRFRASPFRPIRLVSVEEHISANVYSQAFFEEFQTLANLADWYVFNLVGVFRGTFHRMTVAALNMVVERFNPTLTNRQSLKDKLEKLAIAADEKADLQRAVDAYVHEKYQALRKRSAEATMDNDDWVMLEPVAAPAVAVDPATVMNLSRNYQVEAKAAMKQPAILMPILASAVDEMKEQRALQKKWESDSTRRWASRAAKVVACFRGCHYSDFDAFLRAAGDKIVVSKFACPKGLKHEKYLDE
jgi:hypothetical protein